MSRQDTNAVARPAHVHPSAIKGSAYRAESKSLSSREAKEELPPSPSYVAPSGPYTSDDDEFGFPLPIARDKAKFRLIRGRGAHLPKGKGGSSLPPKLALTPVVRKAFRFKATASSLTSVTVGSLLGVLGGVGTTVVAVKQIASAVKLMKVVVWPSPSTSSADTVLLNWAQGASGQDPDEVEDETLPEGVSITRSMSFVPPTRSLAGFWITSTDASSTVFQIQAPVGSVVDVSLHLCITDAFASSTVVVASAVIGTYYYLALDGPASNVYVPTGLPTTH